MIRPLTAAFDKLTELDVIGAIVTAIENSAGSWILAGTLMLTPTVLVLWGWTGSIIAPAVVLALFGGTMIAATNAATAMVGALIVVVGVVMALVAVWRDT